TPTPYMFALGKLVATSTKILNPDGGNFVNEFITSVYYYDEQSRVIQVQTLNPWSTGEYDKTTVQYNFIGQPVLTVSAYEGYSECDKAKTKIQERNVYDEKNGRLL